MAPPLLQRQQIIATLQAALAADARIHAAWEGGSAAFKALDPYSDVDAVVVAADDAVAAAFAIAEQALQTLSPISLVYDVPAAVGYKQKFYQLRDAGEFLVVDYVVLRASDPLLFREVELHGEGHTWFDKSGILVQRHLDAAIDQAAAQARIAPLRTAFAMFQHIPTKERLRGRAVEALHFYQAMTLRPLVEALRLLHCPQRRVFSVRYLARDLPADVCARIERLSFVSDLADLERKHAEAQAWFWETMAALETAQR